MNAREKMFRVLKDKNATGSVPVTPHWWGLYKFAHGGLIEGYEQEGIAWSQGPKEIFEFDKKFYEDFRPDMFHLTTAPDRNPFDQKRWDAIEAMKKREDILEDRGALEEYIALLWRTEEEVTAGGEFGHVTLCKEAFGEEAFIALNEGSDVAWFFDTHIGFEKGLIGMLEETDNVQYFLRKLYDRTFERVKALKKAGADAFINSETYCSADIISPTMYRDIILPIQQEFYTKLQSIDLLPIAYFTGDIMQNIEDIKTLPLAGMMLEASKKAFKNDIGEFAQKIDGKFALFGNLDSHGVLQQGTVEDVVKETKSQLEKTKGYPFIMANDCPVSFQTPSENIRAMIETVRGV